MEAELYEREEGERAVRCRVCPHACRIDEGAEGRCGVRENVGGVLFARTFEELAALEARPIEHVPLFHLAPGARVLLFGSLGESLPPELAPAQRVAGSDGPTRFACVHEVVDLAAGRGASAVCAVGGEPFMWLEMWCAVAEAARADGLRSFALTNGYATAEAVDRVAPHLDGVNLVLLGDGEVYARRGLDPDAALGAARRLQAGGCHLELTYLVVRDLNDDEASVRRFATLASEEVRSACVHVASPIHPETAAPVAAVQRAFDQLADLLPSVYLSPVYAREPAVTTCPRCGSRLVVREPERVTTSLGPDGRCAACGQESSVRL